MTYKIFKDGTQINTIVSDEDFVTTYCAKHGYTFGQLTEADPDPEPAEPDALTQTQIALAELAETESAHDLENKLAIAELAETMIGGTDNG